MKHTFRHKGHKVTVIGNCAPKYEDRLRRAMAWLAKTLISEDLDRVKTADPISYTLEARGHDTRPGLNWETFVDFKRDVNGDPNHKESGYGLFTLDHWAAGA